MQILHELPTPANHSIRPIFLRDQLNNMPSRSNLSFAAPAYNPDSTFKTAVELASAQGLSLTQLLQNLLESVDIPNLTIHTPGRSPNPVSAYEKMLALQTFKSTPQYQLFKARVTHTLTELDRISNSAGTGNQRNTNFQDLGNGLWQPISENESSRFGLFQADLYQQACPDASRLLRMHSFAYQRPDLVASNGEENARAAIRDLSQRLDVCAPGIVQHFDEAVNTVRQAVFTPSLPERFEAMRIQIARNAIAEFINQNPRVARNEVGNEVHRVAAWQNHFSQSLHLPFIDDVFASPSYVENRNDRTHLAVTLADLQTPSAISSVLATQILHEARDLWAQAQTADSIDLTQYCMTIIDTINKRHGAVEPHTLIEMDDNGMPCKLHDNPTLIALSIIRQIEQAPEVHAQQESVRQWTPNHQTEQCQLSIKSRGQLRWIEISPHPGMPGGSEQHLLSSKNLSPEQTREFFECVATHQTSSLQLKAAMHEMLRNDWGPSWPNCKSQDFDPYVPNDVFVNLAMGFAHGLKFGQVDTNLKYMDVLVKVLNNFHFSNVLKQYSAEQICTLLNYAHQLNSSPYGRQVQLDIYRQVNRITNLHRPTVDLSLYKGALQFNWNIQASRSARLAIGNPAFTSPNLDHGFAYIDVMATCAPHLLTDTLCKNIEIIERPEVVIKFLDAGAIFTATNYGQPSALLRLMKHPKDAFVAIVLDSLSQRGVSLHELADPRVIQYLRQKNFVHAIAILSSRLHDHNIT